jgi:hypothetical protein
MVLCEGNGLISSEPARAPFDGTRFGYFPFSGWKDIFMGVLLCKGRDGVEFYTGKKVERAQTMVEEVLVLVLVPKSACPTLSDRSS